jgi:hypothetical protein
MKIIIFTMSQGSELIINNRLHVQLLEFLFCNMLFTFAAKQIKSKGHSRSVYIVFDVDMR